MIELNRPENLDNARYINKGKNEPEENNEKEGLIDIYCIIKTLEGTYRCNFLLIRHCKNQTHWNLESCNKIDIPNVNH